LCSINPALLKRFLTFFVLGFLLLAAALFGATWLLRDRIINQFINQANTHLDTPVQVGEVELSLLRDFPKLSISLRNVYVEDSHPEKFPLFTAKRVAFSFDITDAWNGKYEVLGMEVINSQTNLKYNQRGEPNFKIFKTTTRNPGQPTLSFNIKKSTLTNITVSYNDDQATIHHEFQTDKISASASFANQLYHIVASGDLLIGQLGFKDLILLPNKKFGVLIALDFNAEDEKILFAPSRLTHGSSSFELEGVYEFTSKDFYDFQVKALNTNAQTLISLLPERISSELDKYESSAAIEFQLRLSGEPESHQGLAVTSKFKITDGSMRHPQTNFQLKDLNLSGTFTSIGKKPKSLVELKFDEVNGYLNGRAFTSRLILRDFENPWIDIAFKGEVDSTALAQIIPDSLATNFVGLVQADVKMTGLLADLKSRETVQQVKTEGKVFLQKFSLDWGNRHIPFRNWNGSLSFNGQDLQMKDMTGTVGKSDLRLSGQIRNLPAWLLHDDQPIGIDTRLRSTYLDVDQLLDFGFGLEDASGYKFDISPDLHLRFNYEVSRVNYRRFRGKALKGDLLVRDRVARLTKNNFRSLSGAVELDGTIDARKKAVVTITAGIKTKDILLDSLFYVFEDFGQDFISQKHLKGQMTAQIKLEADLDRALKLIPEKLTADADVLIRKGELNNFEPLQGLSKYLDDKGLRQLRFADLKNSIHIQNKTVFIPGMEIRSNLTTIQLTGKHTFDQQIDYRIVTPLSARRKINKQEAGDAYVEEKGGKAKLYLKITGTTDDYEIAYDGAAVRQKITGEFKQQVKSFKESFKAKEKEQPKKKAQLKEDDFFDWEN